MPNGFGGLYTAMAVSEYQGTTFRNVFWYRHQNGLDGLGQELADGFLAAVNTLWRDFVTVDVNLQSIQVSNLGTVFPDANATWGVVGSNAGPTEPQFVAAQCRLRRSTKETRDGFKRISGIPSAGVTDGSLTGVNFTQWQNLCDAFDSNISDGGAGLFEPIIVNRKSLVNLPTSYTYTNVVGVNARARVTSQNTRKVGRGE